jgi:mRNA interferase YafQ
MVDKEYSFDFKPSFKRDLKKLKKKKYDMEKLDKVYDALAEHDRQRLKNEFDDHQLTGNLKKYRELHVEGDWVVVYEVKKGKNILILMRTGDHDHLLR